MPELRVLYLASIDVPHRKARAIQVVHTSHALARRGARVTLLAGRRGRGTVRRALASFGLLPHPGLQVIRVPIVRLPARWDRWFTRGWQYSYLAGCALVLPRLLLREKPDVVMARDLRLAWLVGRLLPHLAERLVYEAHGLASLEAELLGEQNTSARLAEVERTVFQRSRAVLTLTEELRRLIVSRHGIPPEWVHVIPDATSVPNCSPEAQDDRRGVYYVGQLYPWKGVDTLIHAAKLFPDARYVVVGGTEEDDGRPDQDVLRIRGLAEGLGIGDRVELPGWVPYERVPALLRRAAAAVIPLPDTPFARHFTSPLKLFDYMAAGAPIVASDLPALREVLRHEENGLLVPPGDPSALASALKRLLGDADLATRIGRQASLDVKKYSWDARADRILAVLGRAP